MPGRGDRVAGDPSHMEQESSFLGTDTGKARGAGTQQPKALRDGPMGSPKPQRSVP